MPPTAKPRLEQPFSNSRHLRKLRQYATHDGTVPLSVKPLDALSPAFKDLSQSGKEQTADGEASMRKPPTLRPDLLAAMKTAGIKSLSPMQCKIIDAVLGTAAVPSDGSAVKIVSGKLNDRIPGLGLALLQLCGPKSRAFPIVLCSRNGSGEANHSIHNLTQFFSVKVNAPTSGYTVLMMDSEETTTSTTITDPKESGMLLVDAAALGSVTDSQWSRCSHLILYHEGGEEGSKAFLLPKTLNPKARRLVLTSAVRFLSCPLIAGLVGSSAESEKAIRPKVPIQVLSIEGLPRLQALWLMVHHLTLHEKKKVAVCFDSREATTFHCELFLALDSSAQLALLCDWESNQTDSTDVQRNFVEGKKGKGAVLFTAFGFVDSADVVIQYDPAPMAIYGKRIDDAMQHPRQTIFFFYPCEEKAFSTALESTNSVDLQKVSAPSSAHHGLTMQKVVSMVKKLFTLAIKAFEAYKALMTIYSRLQPTTLYNIRLLKLEKVAEQFGLSEVPLLDLRLKSNAFRPKEDLYKPAAKRRREETKNMIKAQADQYAPSSDSDNDES
jgi:hypothetical protein